MGILERKQREKEQRRNEILDAAEKIIFSKGLEQASMDEIAEMAELSKGTLYLYFKNKEDLYLAINQRGLELFYNKLEKTIQDNEKENGLNQMIKLGETYYHFCEEYPNYVFSSTHYHTRNADSEACDFQEHYQQRERILNLVADTIQRGMDDKSLKADLDPKPTAFLMWRATVGILETITFEKREISEYFKLEPSQIFTLGLNLVKQAVSR